MESDLQDQRFAPPRAHVDDVEAPTDGLQPATRGTRLGAAVIDGIISMLAFWLVSAVTPFNPWQAANGMWGFNFVGWFIVVGAFVLVHGWLLVRRGQTIGKALVKIRIVRPDGTLATPMRVLGLRYGLGWLFGMVPAAGQIWGLLDVLVIFRGDRRCLHDHIADTIVVKA